MEREAHQDHDDGQPGPEGAAGPSRDVSWAATPSDGPPREPAPPGPPSYRPFGGAHEEVDPTGPVPGSTPVATPVSPALDPAVLHRRGSAPSVVPIVATLAVVAAVIVAAVVIVVTSDDSTSGESGRAPRAAAPVDADATDRLPLTPPWSESPVRSRLTDPGAPRVEVDSGYDLRWTMRGEPDTGSGPSETQVGATVTFWVTQDQTGSDGVLRLDGYDEPVDLEAVLREEIDEEISAVSDAEFLGSSGVTAEVTITYEGETFRGHVLLARRGDALWLVTSLRSEDSGTPPREEFDRLVASFSAE